MFNINLSKKDLIARIGFFRNQKGISAYSLSLQIGRSKNYIYRLESGNISLSLDVLFEILEVLNVTLYEFTYPNLELLGNCKKEIENLNLFTEEDKKILETIKQLSSEERKSLLTLLKIKR